MNVTVGYTIQNKAFLIPQIVEGLKKSFSLKDEFYFLFDNCTDNSFEETNKLFGGYFYGTLFEWDIFETKANNRLLVEFFNESKNDTIILFQDDIVANDPLIKKKILRIQNELKENLGLMGGRSGYELNSTSFPEKPINKVSNWEHKENQYIEKLKEGEFAKRTFLNRGPIVFSKKLIEKVGYLNEDYYPQWGDDLDYCARCKFKYELENVVFECNVISKLEWGSMRRKPNPLIKNAIKPNWNRFIKDWGKYIENTTIGQ